VSLTETLEAHHKKGVEMIPAEHMEKMLRATKELIESGIAERSTQVGSAAPSFELPNAVGKSVDVAGLLKDGPVIVSFYRGGWCPYCNLELKALQDRLPEIEALGAKLIAITPETPDNSLTTLEKHDLAFDILSDQGNNVAREFGLVFKLPADVSDIYKNAFGINLEASNGDNSDELPLPATYVIGQDGKVIEAFVSADYTKRLDPDDIIAALKRG